MERSPNLLKKECPNYLRMKGKVYATTFSDSDSSNSNSEESCDREGNNSIFMTIDHIESSNELSLLVEELGEHSDEESMGVVEESGEYARVAKAAVKKMKKAEEDYRSLLV